VELRETFVDLRVIVNALFYTKLHEEDTKEHEGTLDKIKIFQTITSGLLQSIN